MNMQTKRTKLLALAAVFASLFVSAQTQAAITGTPVQCVTDTSGSENSTVDGTDGWSTPTSGNFLAAMKVLKKNGVDNSTASTPSGYTAGPFQETGGAGNSRANYYVYYKTSDGTETSLTVNGSAAAGSSSLMLCEFNSTDLNLSVINVSEDTAEITDNSTKTITSGAASNTQDDALAIFFTGAEAGNDWNTGNSLDNSYVLQNNMLDVAQAGTGLATKVLTTVASNSSTWTTTDTGGRVYGAQLVIDGSTGGVSATPVVRGTIASGNQDSNLGSHVLTYPATVEPTDGIFACIAADSDSPTETTFSWPGTWVKVLSDPGSSRSQSCARYDADGTEDGGTFTVTLNTSQKAAWFVAAIDGWEGSQSPSISAEGSGFDTSPNPPALSPPAGSGNYLYWATGMAPADRTWSAFPSGYADTGSVSPNVSGSASIAWASKETTASSSDDPGVFTISSTAPWRAYTFAFAGTTAASATTTWTDTTVDIGTDIQGTLNTAFTGNPTLCEYASGDTIAVTANASTTAGDCANAKSDFLQNGSLENTRIGVGTTAHLKNDTEVSAAGSITMNSPDNGTTEHFGTLGCTPGSCADADSLYNIVNFPAGYVTGDDIWLTITSGACDFEPTTGVFECTAVPMAAKFRMYSISRTDWSVESTINILESGAQPQAAGNVRYDPIYNITRPPAAGTIINP